MIAENRAPRLTIIQRMEMVPAVRNGRSIRKYDRHASPSARTIHPSLSKPSGAMLLMRENAKIGKCHRYREYEISPTATNNLEPSDLPLKYPPTGIRVPA